MCKEVLGFHQMGFSRRHDCIARVCGEMVDIFFLWHDIDAVAYLVLSDNLVLYKS